jgi:hypothetical protein
MMIGLNNSEINFKISPPSKFGHSFRNKGGAFLKQIGPQPHLKKYVKHEHFFYHLTFEF